MSRMHRYLCCLSPVLLGCGPTEVLIGDAAGIARVVAGVPGATRSADQIAVADTGGPRPAVGAALGEPYDVVAFEDGSFYFSDRIARRVGFVSADGQLSWPVGIGPCGLARPQGIDPRRVCFRSPAGLAKEPGGGLLITDEDGQWVYRYLPNENRIEPVFGTGGPGIASDSEVATEARTFGPVDVGVGPDGSLYVVEDRNNRVVRIDAGGLIRIVAGTGIRGDSGDGSLAVEARLASPRGLEWVDDILYIADTGNNRIRRIVSDTIFRYSGLGAPGFAGDGESVSLALYNRPTKLAAVGELLFISDTDNHRVRAIRVGADSVVTFAGTGSTLLGPDLLEIGRTALAAPVGIAAAGRAIYIADSKHYVIRRVIR